MADFHVSAAGSHVTLLVTNETKGHVRIAVKPETGPSVVLVLTIEESLGLEALLSQANRRANR